MKVQFRTEFLIYSTGLTFLASGTVMLTAKGNSIRPVPRLGHHGDNLAPDSIWNQVHFLAGWHKYEDSKMENKDGSPLVL